MAFSAVSKRFIHCVMYQNKLSAFAACNRDYGKAIYSINHEFLDHGIPSHRHAWFWGLFLTDGYVSKTNEISWGQRYDSYPMLDRIRSIVDSTHPLIFKGTNHEGALAVQLKLYSKSMAMAAIQLMGCAANRKTFELKFPAQVNPEIYPSLVGGTFSV